MGCAQSRIENEEAVARCKERRQWMRSAVSARSAFAAAHSAYAVSLKNTGASLSEFAHAHSHSHSHSHSNSHSDSHLPLPDQTPQTPQTPSPSAAAAAAAAANTNPNPNPSSSSAAAMDSLPPPPPPLPDFSPSPKIHRSISMPPPPPSPAPIREEDEDEDEEEEEEEAPQIRHKERRRSRSPRPDPAPAPAPALAPEKTAAPPPPPPMPEARGMDTWDYFFAMDESMAAAAAADEEIRPERDSEHEDEKFSTPPPPPPPPPPNVDDDSSEPRTPEKSSAAAAPPLDPLPPLPPKPPGRNQNQKQKPKLKPGGAMHHHHQHTASAPPFDGATRGKTVAAEPEPEQSVNFLQVFTDLDEHFLKASESTHEVSKKLEANRMHYHSNFVDSRGHIDHSARVMKVITWNRSFKGMSNGDDGKDDFYNDEGETHATVLDKMLAWEKKLYEEVKTGELMKIEYQRKVALLNKQKKRGATTETLERTKAAVSHLHTRYIVDMQSMDSTVSEIQHLRDNQLYPRLVDLVDEMGKMWEMMYLHHESQLKIVLDLKALDISNSPMEMSDHHHRRTIELHDIVKEWHSQFQKLISHQKDYMQALNSWLKLNLIPIESSLKEKVSSPPRAQHPPIQALLHAWNDHLEKLPEELAKSALNSFAAVMNTIVTLQQDEMKQKEKCEETRKEFQKKSRAFEDWYYKYSQRRTASAEEADGEGVTEGTNPKDPVSERKFLVESVKSRLDDEVEAYNKLCKQVREKSLTSLKTHLPELFRALSDFAHSCADMYSELKMVSPAQNPAAN